MTFEGDLCRGHAIFLVGDKPNNHGFLLVVEPNPLKNTAQVKMGENLPQLGETTTFLSMVVSIG